MKLWPRRRQTQAAPPRANATRIAVLEHDLLGITPRPGTATAAVLALRRAGNCIEHDPVDASPISQPPGTLTICCRCGNPLELRDTGTWRTAR